MTLGDIFPRTNRQPCMASGYDSDAHGARSIHKTSLLQANAPLYSKGAPEIVVVLANFSDVKFSDPSVSCPGKSFSDLKDLYEQFFNGRNFTNNKERQPHYNSFSVGEYFELESKGLFTPHFTILDPVTVPNTKASYPNTSREKFMKDALAAASSQIAERISDFDKNNGQQDGVVDGVIVVFPGQGANTTFDDSTDKGYIHPCTRASTTTSNGISYATQIVVPELLENSKHQLVLNGIGVYVHEFCHMLGLPDFYDTSHSPKGAGMDYWSLMDNGEYVNNGYNPANFTAYEKEYMGWIEIEELKEPKRIKGMKAIANGGKAYKIYNEGNRKEYYILENRTYQGDVVYNTLGRFYGEGLMIYHVDEDAQAWGMNEVNNKSDHQRMTIVPANGHFEILNNLVSTNMDGYYSELSGHLWPLKSSFYSDLYKKDLKPLEYWGVEGNNALTDEARYNGDRVAPAATMFNANTDGKFLMHKSITNIVMNDDKTVSFDFDNPDIDLKASIKYVYTFDGEEVHSYTKTQEGVNSMTVTFDEPKTFFGAITTDTIPEAKEVTDEESEFTVTYKYTLDSSNIPFVATKIEGEGENVTFAEGTKWYYLQPSATTNYCYSNGANDNISVKESSSPVIDTHSFFAFTGNPISGYKIHNYNKVAPAAISNTEPRVSFTNTGSVYLAEKGTEEGQLRFRLSDATSYLNAQEYALMLNPSIAESEASVYAGSQFYVSEISSKNIDAAKAAYIAEGVSGTCRWTLSKDSVLTIEPIEGKNGTLSAWTESTEVPWAKVTEKIKYVEFKDDIKVLTCAYMFMNCTKIGKLDISELDIKDVKDMTKMFYGCTSLRGIDLTGFTITEGTKIDDMFAESPNISSISSMTSEPSALIEGTFASLATKGTCELITPDATETYKNAIGWKELFPEPTVDPDEPGDKPGEDPEDKPNEDPDAINGIATDASEGQVIYSVYGVRVNSSYKGIVIINGKKVKR